MAWAPPRCPRSPSARWPSAGKRGKGGLRKVKLAGAREGGRRGAPRRRRATCTRYVAAAPARAAWAGVWGVTRGKRGGAGRGAASARAASGRAVSGRPRALASARVRGAVVGARMGLGGHKTGRAPRAQTISCTDKSSVRPRHLLCPRAAMCTLKRPPRGAPQQRPVPRTPREWIHPLNAPFRGRSAVERGARCAKFAASFHRGPWEEGDRGGTNTPSFFNARKMARAMSSAPHPP